METVVVVVVVVAMGSCLEAHGRGLLRFESLVEFGLFFILALKFLPARRVRSSDAQGLVTECEKLAMSLVATGGVGGVCQQAAVRKKTRGVALLSQRS